MNKASTNYTYFSRSFFLVLLILTYSAAHAQQGFVTFDTASLVVGQETFENNVSLPSQSVTAGARASAISSKGVLAIGSQDSRRVLLWNSVPAVNGEPADIVVGQADFETVSTAGSASVLGRVSAVAFSPDGNKLLVADEENHRILIWNSIPTTNGQAADIVIGQSSPSVVPADPTFPLSNPSDTTLYSPTGILVTPGGRLIISDFRNNRVLIFNKIPTVNNTAANVVIGQTNFTVNSNGTSATKLFRPYAVSLSPGGKLIISDQGNHRVLIYNSVPTTNGVAADVVIGQSDFISGAAGTSASKLKQPTGVTVSPVGELAIGDFGNNRVLIFNTIPTVNNATADIVLGQPNFTSSVSFNNGEGVTSTPSARNMNTPYGINFDLNGRLFVNGRGMNRVMVYGELPEEEAELSMSFALGENGSCAAINEAVEYTLIVTNNGPDAATNVVAYSALPSGFTLDGTPVASTGSYDATTGYWNIPSISNNGSVTLTFTGIIDTDQANSSITAYASITSSDQLDESLNNNAANIEVSVTANEAPTISAIGEQVVDENTTTSEIAFTIGDVDSPSGDLVVSATSSNINLVPNANIVLGGSALARTITITPAPDKGGVTYIEVLVSDGICETTRVFKLTVNKLNFAPTISNVGDQTIDENESAGPLDFTISDPETSAAGLIVTATSSDQTLLPDANILLAGTGSERTITVTPATEKFGESTITIAVSDGVNETLETFKLTVNEINSIPTISSISNLSILINTSTDALSFNISDTETNANDLIVSASSNNVFLVPNDNIILDGTGENRTITVTPTVGETGSTLITLTVSDGINEASVDFTLNVLSSNTAPTISVIEDLEINENTTTEAISFTVNDAESPSEDLTVTASSDNQSLIANSNMILGGSGANRTVTLTPETETFGTSLISITVSDGIDEVTETFTLTVSEINDAPEISEIENQEVQINASTGPILFTVNDTETDSESLSVTASSDNQDLIPNANITLNGTGVERTITLSPVSGMSGIATISISVSDGNSETIETFVLTVLPENTPPTISAIEDQEISQNTSTAAISFTINDLETASENLIIIVTSNNAELLPEEGIVVAGTGTSRTITLTPVLDKTGSSEITVNVSDGELSSSTTFTLTVNEITGIHNDEFAQSITLFPNPSSKASYLLIKNEDIGQLEVSVIDFSGRTLLSYSADKINHELRMKIDSYSLAPGVYIILIQSEKYKAIKKLIKE